MKHPKALTLTDLPALIFSLTYSTKDFQIMINWALGSRGFKLGAVLRVELLCFPGYLEP